VESENRPAQTKEKEAISHYPYKEKLWRLVYAAASRTGFKTSVLLKGALHDKN